MVEWHGPTECYGGQWCGQAECYEGQGLFGGNVGGKTFGAKWKGVNLRGHLFLFSFIEFLSSCAVSVGHLFSVSVGHSFFLLTNVASAMLAPGIREAAFGKRLGIPSISL
jgi:hypothetical protein